MCCSDSATEITKLHDFCIKHENRDDFILITADSGIEINDAQ